MRRAFLSLYGLLVVSVISVGWGLDRLWNSYFASAPNHSAQHLLVSTLAEALDQQPAPIQLPSSVDANLNLKIVPLESFAQSKLLDQILLGAPIETHHTDRAATYYQHLPQHNSVLRLEIPNPASGQSHYSDLLLIVFYGSLALVVFLWMWPLSRDLAKLEKQTRVLGKEPIPDKWQIGPTSAIYDVARAFERMSERIQELLATHKEMTYAVSHELRTPLARMKFALEIAATQKTPDKILDKIQSVRDDVTEMDALVNQLLAYAGFEQGEQEMDVQSGDLKAMVEHLLTRIRTDTRYHHIRFAVESELSDLVRCEWGLIERAVINLVLNAARFANTEVIVKLHQQAQQIHIEVHDDGPGIPASERDRVLQSFVRLTNHTNSQARGFGLGLAIVHRVMSWHQGKVTIEDSTLGGAKVSLHWPTTL